MGKKYEPLSRDPAYDQALSYLYGLQKFGMKFGLSKTENLLQAFDRPQDQLKLIHIAGTNGKGSVAAMAASIFSRAGYRVGLYTSPHLVDFRERFQINGRLIPPGETLDLIREVKERTNPEEPPTFFELVTAMALIYFAREKVDLAIIEAGLGGRLDATNVIRPRVTAITTLSLEHQEYLGNSLRRIAWEKGGIIKAGIPLVSGVTQPSAREVISRLCREQGAPLFLAGRDFQTRKIAGTRFNYAGFGKVYKGLRNKLLGPHQIRNAGLALSLVNLWPVEGKNLSEDSIREGLLQVNWPGRMEVWTERPRMVLDGAHNPAAMKVLAGTLPETLPYKRLLLVIGIMQDKDIAAILAPIVPLADRVFLTRAEYIRSAEPEKLLSFLDRDRGKCRLFPALSQAIDQAVIEAADDDLICITGSLFVVGEARAYLEKSREIPKGADPRRPGPIVLAKS
jgi:dihydrofolate synthase/folylpolyglutamate synthase